MQKKSVAIIRKLQITYPPSGPYDLKIIRGWENLTLSTATTWDGSFFPSIRLRRERRNLWRVVGFWSFRYFLFFIEARWLVRWRDVIALDTQPLLTDSPKDSTMNACMSSTVAGRCCLLRDNTHPPTTSFSILEIRLGLPRGLLCTTEQPASNAFFVQR